MSHLVARELWGTVDLDTSSGRIWVQQDWFYTWTVNPGATPWTVQQQRHFHNTLDQQIWHTWSNRLQVQVNGAPAALRRLSTTRLSVTFDIRWVLRGGHWQVHVRKLAPRSSYRSNVTFATRRIELDSGDLDAHTAGNANGRSRTFRTGPHEFGHTLDNPDEYNAGSAHLVDTDSVMNIGSQLRARHIELVLATLGRLAPGCAFTA